MNTFCYSQEEFLFDKYNNQHLYTKGANFSIEIPDCDSIKDLYSLNADSIYVLFYDPYCEHCKKEIKHLRKDKSLNKRIEAKELIFLTIAPDIEKDEWLKCVKKMPKQWLNAYSSDNEMIIKKYLWKVPELFVFDREKIIHKIEMYKEEYDE